MAASNRKRQLFENVVRLRRAQRELPGNRDVAAVRAALEDELGEAVSQRLAARLLGVSHTALARWVKRGDVPVVFTESGHEEVPVPALLDLYEAVEEQRAPGRRRLHVLEPGLREARERASQMRPEELVDGPQDADPRGRAERRSLAYHRAVARVLRREMVDDALQRVWKWRDQGKLDPRYVDLWEEILGRPVGDVARAIGEDTPAARDLRLNSPFAGMLSDPERARILEAIR